MKAVIGLIVWLFATVIIGGIYFGIAYALTTVINPSGIDIALYIVAGCLTAWNSFVVGLACLAIAVEA